jgi:broad specificity phosphatase PhoE
LIRVIIVRHGVTEWNQAGRYQGQHDVPLAPAGREQAFALRDRLAHEQVTAAFSSDLSRARETAEIALSGHRVPVATTPQLRELAFGSWEGLRHDEIADRFPEQWAAWARNPGRIAPPDGGESLIQLRERLLAFYRANVADHRGNALPVYEPTDWFSYRGAGEQSVRQQTLAVFSHGGATRVLLTALFEMPVERYWSFGVRPASITVLEVYPEGPIAEVIGDTSHLER